MRAASGNVQIAHIPRFRACVGGRFAYFWSRRQWTAVHSPSPNPHSSHVNAPEPCWIVGARGLRLYAPVSTKELLDPGAALLVIVEERSVPGMADIGEKFKNNEIFVPEMLIAARAMREAMV